MSDTKFIAITYGHCGDVLLLLNTEQEGTVYKIFLLSPRKARFNQVSYKSVQWDRVVLCGQTNMKLTVAFRNFANAPKKALSEHHKMSMEQTQMSATVILSQRCTV